MLNMVLVQVLVTAILGPVLTEQFDPRLGARPSDTAPRDILSVHPVIPIPTDKTGNLGGAGWERLCLITLKTSQRATLRGVSSG
jgi:hypothetical protein